MLKIYRQIGGGWIPLLIAASFASGEAWVPQAGVVAGREAVALSVLGLPEAIQIAKASNPRLLAALANIVVAEGEGVEDGLWENPELEVYSEEIPVDSGGFQAAKNMVGISQTVPFPGKKSLDRKAADLSIEQRHTEYRATELEVTRDVKVAFYRVLAAQQSVEIFEELSSLSQSLAKTVGKRLKAGEAPAQELLRAEIEWQRASTETEKSRGELAEARQELAAILGRSGLRGVRLSGELSSDSAGTRSTHIHLNALQNHPRLKQARLAVQEAKKRYKRSRKNSLPDVTLELAFGNRNSELEGSENLAEVSVSFPLPLIDRGQGAERVASGKLSAAQAHLAATEQELHEAVENAKTRFLTATKRVNTYRDGILPKIDKALSLTQRGFQEGKFSFIDLLDTQRTVAETRLEYQEALFDMNAAEAILDSLSAHEENNDEEK